MEKRQYRIYTSSMGDTIVFDNIVGDKQLERAIEQARHWHPGDTIFVREVSEKVVLVVRPDGTRQQFD